MNILKFFVFICFSQIAFAGNDTNEISGKAIMMLGAPASDASFELPNEITPKWWFKDGPAVERLFRSFSTANEVYMQFYMYTVLYVVFIDSDGKVLSAYEYYPASRPDSGFRRVSISRNDGKFLFKGPRLFDARKGIVNKYVSNFLRSQAPQTLIWPLKE